MFRPMRRAKQQLSDSVSRDILKRGKYGVLALSGDDGYPYAVPLNYDYSGGKIYFHCAKSGHKIDAIKSCSKASFCVVDSDELVPQEYTTYFRSVIVFGKVRIIEDETEKLRAIERIAVKFNPNDSEQSRKTAIQREFPPLCILEMEIEHISGKEAIELVRKRKDEYVTIPAKNTETLNKCFKMREDVFIKERCVPAEIERDENDILDGVCDHFLITRAGEPVGALRCMHRGVAVVLQRFCVLKEYRGSGAGSAALRFVEDFYGKKGISRIELDSKFEAKSFYERNGYKTVSEPFEEAGIPHVKMLKELEGKA